MKITNNQNLPQPIVDYAYSLFYKPSEERISATDLAKSPYARFLKITRWDDITEDVSDLIWALFGSSFHNMLTATKDPNVKTELAVKYEVSGKIISGRVDYYHAVDGILEDYKVCKAWALVFGIEDWINQMNIYDFLLRQNGFNVNKIYIRALLKDWDAIKSLRDKQYPKSAMQTLKIPRWDKDVQYAFILSCINKHKEYGNYICTDEDRWKKPDKFAVKKKGALRALKLHDTLEAAKLQQLQKGENYLVEERPGGYRNCEKYCSVRSVCNIKKTI